MKKYLTGNLKRWIAFLLAVVLIVTTCVYSSDASLRANDEGDTPNQTEAASGEQEIEPVDVGGQDGSGEEESSGDQNEPGEEESSGDQNESGEEESSGDQEEPEVEEGSEDPEGDLEDGEVTDEDAVTDPVENPEEAPKSPEEEVSVAYSYAIYYYYDGVEDVNARVEKEDGVLGEKILASVNVEEEVTFNGKNYKLGQIENKDGEITEEAKDNVVSVYYVLVEKVDEVAEEDAVYTLEVKNTPSEGGKVEVVSVEGEKADGKNAYKENAEVTFEVSVNEGYELLAVADQANTELEAKSQNKKDSVYTYTVTMTEDKVVTVTYEKVEDEKKAVEEMPAQTLEASAGAVSVTINAPEGVLPEGTTVEASAVGSDDVSEAIVAALAEKGLFPTEISAVDITLTKDGEKVSPKGNVTVKLDNVFTSDVPSTEAAVYHVNGSSAEYVSSADPSASSVEFTTDHFSVYAAVKAGPADEYGMETLAETGDKGINRGVKIFEVGGISYNGFYVQGTKEWEGDHNWTLDNTDVVRLDGDLDLSGVRLQENKSSKTEGSAILTHTCGNNKEYWTIKRIAIPSLALRVYVYLDVEVGGVDTTDWMVNGHNYYTVGYIDVSTDKVVYKEGRVDNEWLFDFLQNEVKNGNVVVLNPAINIDLKEVSSWKLIEGAYEADDFANADTETYHLDGKIEMEYGSFTVEYWIDDDLVKKEIVKKPIKKGSPNISVESEDIDENPFDDECEFDCYMVDGKAISLPESIANNGTVQVHYKSIKKTYNLYYYGGKGVSKEPVKYEYKVGEPIKVAAPDGLLVNSNENAVFAKLWKSSEGEIVNDGYEFKMPEQDVTLTAQWKVLTVDKKVEGIYGKDENKKTESAAKGDIVYFEITVTNEGDVDLSDITVTENGITAEGYSNSDVTIEKNKIDKLSPGETETIKASYTVTGKEVGKTNVINTVTVEEQNVTAEAKAEIPMEDVDKQFTVEKKIVKKESATGNYSQYRTGDTVWFDVTVKNTGNVGLKDIYVEEDDAFKDAVIHEGLGYDIKDNKAVIGDLEPDTEVVISVSYEIKETDLGKTDFRNKVTVTTDGIGSKDGISEPIPVEEKSVKIKLKKSLTDKEGKQAGKDNVNVGDTIYYRIYIENEGNVDLYNLDVKDILSKSLDGNVDYGQVDLEKERGTAEVEIKGNQVVITKLPFSGESEERNITFKCSYKVTENDAGKTIGNTVTVRPQEYPGSEWKDDAESVKVNGFGYRINYYYDSQLAEDETIEKSDATYDELIEYITEQTAFDKEYKSENYMLDKALIGEKVIAKVVGRGEEASLEAEVITATSDNQVINVYYVKDSNGPKGEPDRIPDSEEYSVTYHSGRYSNDADVIDEFLYPEGYSVRVMQNTFKKIDDSVDFAYWKTTDIEKVEIIEPDVEFNMPNRDVNLTAQWKALIVYKEVAGIIDSENKEKRVANVNDRVDFIITVENVGDVPLKLVVSDDGLSVEGSPVPSNVIIDDNSGYEVIDNQAVIDSLAAEGKVEVKAHYIVTENEIGKTNVTNKATAKGDGVEKTGETDPIPMEGVYKWLTVEKEIVDRDKTATGSFENGSDGLCLYTTGDTVRFEVKVTNTGNQTLKDITIEDLLEGATIESGSWLSQIINGYTLAEGKPVINELKPLESATFKASYVIKEADLGRHFYNTVSAKADGQEWKGNSKEIPVDNKKPSAKVEKRLNKIVDSDGNEVIGREPKEGDVIHYQIEVENVGNMDLENIRVEDILHVSPEDEVGDRQVTFEEMPGVTIEGNVAIIAKLDRVDTNNNRKITLNCSYQVRRADAGKVIMNGVNVSSDTKKPDGSDLDVEKPAKEVEVKVQNLYTLSVNYVYEAGGVAAPSYTGQYYEGDIYRVDSPVIDGYSRVAFVAGAMPKDNLTLTVVYATTATPPTPGGDPDPDPDPVDPDTPPVTPVTPVDEGPDPVIPPVEPEVPGEPGVPGVPGGPGVPGAPGAVVVAAPAAPALVTVGDTPVPLEGALIETDDDGNVTVIPITEDEIPLANKEIDDHKCCILSFLLMLATLIIYSWFTHSMKKRQKKLAELKDQLAEETLKRQLGITDESSNRR